MYSFKSFSDKKLEIKIDFIFVHNPKFFRHLNRDNIFFIFFLFFFGLLMYLNLLRYYIPISENIVPWGDPFTYEMGYYDLLNKIDQNEYYGSIRYIFGTNWYWLQKILLFIFSPILINEPYSLCLINFFTYTVASILFYFLLIELNIDKTFCRILSIIFWFYPINYSFKEYSALALMGLDSTFLGSLYCLIFSYLTFLKKPTDIKYQISFSIFLCAALIGRGNSITIIFLIIFFPSIFFLYRVYKKKNFKILKNFKLPLIFFLFTALVFYSLQLKYILGYYSVFKGFLTNDLSFILPYLKHIPGIFFIYPDPSEINLMSSTDYSLLLISLSCHLINIFSFYHQRKLKNFFIRMIILTGLFIFYGTFLINLTLWMHPHINIYNAQLIWAPMRIGFTLTISIIILEILKKFKKQNINLLTILVFSSIFLISSLLYQNNKEIVFKNKIDSNPDKIKKIYKFINKNSQNRKISVLWYDPYLSPRILNYYALKDNLEPIEYFRGKYADDIWNQSNKSTQLKNNINQEIKNIFKYSNLIILNENSDNYVGGYAFYRYKKFIGEQIEDNKLDNFKIIAKIKSSRGNLLVFKRQNHINKNFYYFIDKQKSYKIIYGNIKNSF